MYCKKCGARISDICEFCTNCGAKVESISKTEAPSVAAKCICPECGAKNDLNARDCIQCEKKINKSELTFTCPDCGSIMKNGYTECPICKFDFRTGRKGQHEEFAYSSTTSRGYEGANVYQKEKKRHMRPIPIIICASAAAIVLVIVFCKLFFENRAAQDMYNLAYTAVYDTDMTYISPRTEQLVDSAYEQSQSIFVLSGTKDMIEELKQTSDDYIKLAEAEDLMLDAPIDNILSIQEKINNINSTDVKESDRYKYIKPRMEDIKFQASNRSWAEKKLEELRESRAELIQSWGRAHAINYYVGAVYFVEVHQEIGLDIRLEDYEGNSHYLRLQYNFDEGGDWDAHIGELSQKLVSGERCVMAAIAATQYGDYDEIFTYSYRSE